MVHHPTFVPPIPIRKETLRTDKKSAANRMDLVRIDIRTEMDQLVPKPLDVCDYVEIVLVESFNMP